MKHILLIDDEEFCCFILKEYLAEAGFSVAIASTAEQALERAELMMPDVIVSDFRLGSTRSGIDVARDIRKQNPNIQVILFTGFGAEELKREAESVGCFQVLQKPLEADAVVKAVQDAIRAMAPVAAETVT